MDYKVNNKVFTYTKLTRIQCNSSFPLFPAVHRTGSRVYFPCGPSSQETCRSVTVPVMTSVTESCEEGCYCAVGTVLHDQQWVSRGQCPCQYRGKMFQPGEKVPKDWNTWQVLWVILNFKKSFTVVRICSVVLWKLLLVQHINFIELEFEVWCGILNLKVFLHICSYSM